ncbi:hypothetical protein [Altericroceibacterium xinjiangense]|uniref:hypothetical protein n=1 Tax=Altericroceibacterium xinjiangense TaxID=762261 RepID=UPI000F7DFD60|nr:hypothetical protein [Altericroceibacterium xinjiangense]
MSSTTPKPFLIAKDEQGEFRLTVRETRYNSQGFPWVVATPVEQCFETTAAAKAYAVDQFGAKAGEFATK